MFRTILASSGSLECIVVFSVDSCDLVILSKAFLACLARIFSRRGSGIPFRWELVLGVGGGVFKAELGLPPSVSAKPINKSSNFLPLIYALEVILKIHDVYYIHKIIL